MDRKRLDEIRDITRAEIDAAASYFDSVRTPAILKRYQIYDADPAYYRQIFSKLANVSDYVSKDVANSVEWAMPSLMNVFTGGSSVVSIIPHGSGTTEEAAEINQKLLDFQLQTLNNSSILFYRWFKDALIAALGIVKAWWHEDSRTEKKTLTLMPQEYMALVQDLQAPGHGNARILSVRYLEDGSGLIQVDLSIEFSYRSYPKIAPVPPWECLYNPKCLDIHESPFVCHRREVTVDYLRKRARNGEFDPAATAEAIRLAAEEEISDNILKQEIQADLSMYEEPDKTGTAAAKTVLYEAYLDYDINGDGLLEPIVVTLCNGQVLRVEENTFGAKPFFGLSPMIEPYQPDGKSYADIIEDIQTAKTAMMRQVLLNVAQSNDPRLFVKDGMGVNISDILANKSIIRVKDINAVKPVEIKPLAPWTFNVLEMLEVDKENRTGVTRYSQGLDSSSLNSTATGIMKIMEASQQRLALIARLFAETGVRNLFRFMVGLNQRFIKQEQVIRVAGKMLRIMPDDLQGEFDFVVEPTALVGGKEQQIAAMKEAINMAPVLLKLGYMSQRGFYNLVTRYYEALGLKGVEKYIDNEPTEVTHGGPMESTGRPGETTGQGIEGQGFNASPQGVYPGSEAQYTPPMAGGGPFGPGGGGTANGSAPL